MQAWRREQSGFRPQIRRLNHGGDQIAERKEQAAGKGGGGEKPDLNRLQITLCESSADLNGEKPPSKIVEQVNHGTLCYIHPELQFSLAIA